MPLLPGLSVVRASRDPMADARGYPIPPLSRLKTARIANETDEVFARTEGAHIVLLILETAVGAWALWQKMKKRKEPRD